MTWYLRIPLVPVSLEAAALRGPEYPGANDNNNNNNSNDNNTDDNYTSTTTTTTTNNNDNNDAMFNYL